MRLKKFLSLAMASAMLTLTMATGVTAFADITVSGGQSQGAVKVKTTGSTANPRSYNVSVDWDSLEFEYNFGTRTWDPAKHDYKVDPQSGWTKSTADITVTNHSNVGVTVSVTYSAAGQNYGISGSITGGRGTLESAEGKTPEQADSLTARLTLDTAPTTSITQSTQIGTVTVRVG